MKKMLGIILMAALMAGGSTSSAMAADIDPAGEQWGFIFEQLTNPNYVTMSGVALDYCEELGIELQIVDGGESSDTIINAAENMATQHTQYPKYNRPEAVNNRNSHIQSHCLPQ